MEEKNNKEEKNVLQRLLEARETIAKTPIKKEGSNKFSNYDYFTPSQVTALVIDASIKHGILSTFKAVQKDDVIQGFLTVTNIHDKEDFVEFTIPTSVPDIKATSSTQKLGGMVTYTQRYLEMLAFGISDNNLDLDSQDNRGAKVEPQRPAKPAPAAEKKKPKVKLDEAQLNSVCEMLAAGNAKFTKEKIIGSYDLTKEQVEKINAVEVPQKTEK